jgi:TP901 family phage tail tape measure protein
MAQLTSQLVVRLIDLVSGPARGVATSLRGIGTAARSLNAVSMAGVARQIAADGRRVRAAVGAVGTSIGGIAGGLGLYKLHHDVYEFAKATNKLASANPDVAAEQIERIKALAREVSRTSLFDPATVMNAANALARADVSMAAIEGSLKPLANAAMAADVPVSQLADDFVKLASGFGLAYKTREEAQETFSYLADLAQYVSQKAPGQFNDFVQGMKQVAPSVRSLGVSIEWLAGAYIMLDKAGIRNEEAGTAIKSMFKSIVQPTASARGMMAQLGIDPSEFTKRAASVKSEQLVKRLAAEYGKDFSRLGPELQRILESGGTTVAMQKSLVGAIESQWGKMKPQDARKLAKTVGNFLASGVSAIDPQAWLDALAKRGVTFGQFLQMVEPRQAQRLSNLARQAGEAGEAGDAARKALETPLTQMLEFRRGLADAAAAKMMQGYRAAIAKLAAAWTSFIETLDTSGVIDRVASALTSLGTALANVFKGDASLKDWGIAFAAALPLIAPLTTAIASLGFAFKGLAAAISLAAAAFIKLPIAGIAGVLGAGTGASAGAGTAAAGLGVAAALKKGAVHGAALAGLTAIKRDAEKEGQPLRTWLRSLLAIEDEHEPAPWQKGGAGICPKLPRRIRNDLPRPMLARPSIARRPRRFSRRPVRTPQGPIRKRCRMALPASTSRRASSPINRPRRLRPRGVRLRRSYPICRPALGRPSRRCSRASSA